MLDTYATLAVTLAEKQKTSEAFCMILLKRCMHLIAPFTPNNDWSPDEFDSNSKDTRGLSSLNEYCKILTFILIHRQALFEHLFCRSHSQSIQNQGSSSQHGQQRGQVQVKGRGGSIHKDEDIVEEARLEAGRFLLTGLQLLLPRDRDYMAYELYLQGESGSEESAERQRRQEFERAVRFCAWFSSNRNQVSKLIKS